jgi:hypothetical protein
MPFEKQYDQTQPARGAVCIHLRSKSMYVKGQIKVPDDPSEAGSQHCWCNLTQHVIGPDQRNVERHDCVDGRGCFRDTY